jgi:hypothetical protein
VSFHGLGVSELSVYSSLGKVGYHEVGVEFSLVSDDFDNFGLLVLVAADKAGEEDDGEDGTRYGGEQNCLKKP